MKKSLIWMMTCVMVLSLALSGCGGSKAPAKAGEANKLIVAQAADAVTLDPHKTNDSASATPMKQIYNTLVTLDENMQIVPSLATEWKQVDDLTWEFKLREGVKFHNGEELKASDVKFTFDRLTNPSTAAPGAFMLSAVSETKVIDNYTVQLVTKDKFASILYNLTHVATGILNEKAVTAAGDTYGQSPVGTGPFKFVEWKKNQEINMARNDDYFLGAARLEKLTFRIIPESATQISELKTGGVDLALDVQPQYVGQFDEKSGLVLDRFSTFITKYLGFDIRQKPFDDVRVRQAINYATNKDAIIKVAYDGNAELLTGPLPPKINGYNETLTGYEYNVEKAKQLLAEAGYPDGFTSTLYLSDKEEDNKIATTMQAQLKDVGIIVDLQVIEWGAYLNKTAQGVPMFLLGWTTVTADADNGMYSNFHSSAFGSQGNRIFYSNPEVDKLLDQGRAEFDAEKRVQCYKDASKIVADEAAWDFLTARQYLVGRNARVQGFVPSPTTIFEFYPVSLAPQA